MKLLKVCKLIGIKVSRGVRFLFSYEGCSIVFLSLYWIGAIQLHVYLAKLYQLPKGKITAPVMGLVVFGGLLTLVDFLVRITPDAIQGGFLEIARQAIDAGAKAYDEIIETQEKATAQDGQLSAPEEETYRD